MRAPLQFSLVGPSAGAECALTEVRNTIMRDYYLRSTWNGVSAYVVDVYRSLDDATTQSSKLASATHAAGYQVEATFTVAGGAPFDPTPMKATFNASGTWTSCVTGWIAGVQAALLDRMSAILARYGAANEAMEGIAYAGVGLGLPTVLPAFGIEPGESNPKPAETNRFSGAIGMKLWAAAEGMSSPTVVRQVVDYAERLRSIALDEQRTWGGFAQQTVARGPIEPAVSVDDQQVVFLASLPIEIQVADFVAERGPSDSSPGTGGKYVVGL